MKQKVEEGVIYSFFPDLLHEWRHFISSTLAIRQMVTHVLSHRMASKGLEYHLNYYKEPCIHLKVSLGQYSYKAIPERIATSVQI